MKKTGKPYVEPADYIPEDIRKELKIGEYAEEKEDVNAIRKKHALMECDHEIEWCQKILNSDAPEEAKDDARYRIDLAMKKRKQIENAE